MMKARKQLVSMTIATTLLFGGFTFLSTSLDFSEDNATIFTEQSGNYETINRGGKVIHPPGEQTS